MYQIVQTIPEMDKSRWIVKHLECGKLVTIYIWSFRGRGCKICPHCKKKIMFRDEVASEKGTPEHA